MVGEQQRRGRGRASSVILASKHRRPTLAAGSIQRPRLLDRLSGGIPLSATILAAPAGYGKTVLACQWLVQSRIPSAWLSLEPGDGELPIFLIHLTAAVRSVFPRALPQIERLSRTRQRLAERELTTLLLNELEVLPARMALVLDDYHLVAAEPVKRLFGALLRHPPRGLHPVFLTRFDPLLPLDELRAHGDLSEIRELDLRFTRTEIEQVLAGELGAPVDAELASVVEEKTGGWPVGLRLGLEARRNRGDPGALISSATGPFDDEHIHRFLASEVLAAQPARLRRPLLMISVLDRFCAPLCDALLADGNPDTVHPSGREVLDWLSQHNLFISRLGGEGEWYRYHHFFQGLLRAQLELSEATDVSALHRRAGEWLAGNGFPDEALDQLLAADDLRGAAEIILCRGQSLLDEGDWHRLTRLLTRFPRERADLDPRILSLEAWARMGASSHARVVERAVARIDELLGSGATPAVPDVGELGGSQDVLRGCLALAAGDPGDALRLAERGLAALPRDRERQTAFGCALRIVCLQATGDYPAALTAAEDSSLDAVIGTNRLRPWEFGRAHAAWLEVDLRSVRAGAENLLVRGESDGLPDLAAAGRYLLGIERYARNDLAGADEILGPLVDDHAGSLSDYFVHGMVALCLTRQALGRPAEAWALGERLAGLAAERGQPFLLSFAQAVQAELDLLHGRAARASRWVEWYRPQSRQPGFHYDPVLTAVKAGLATNSPHLRLQADRLLAGQLARAESVHDRAAQIPLLGLRALAADAAGNRDSATLDLGRAVSLSQPSGAVRLLADLGADLIPVLLRLEVEGEDLKHAGSILAAIRGIQPPEPLPEGAAAGAPPAPQGFDGLTERESAVLGMLARRYSNKEIARELLISTATVKKHTVALYRKLHVAGRHEAVEKSLVLGYLPVVRAGREAPAGQLLP